MGSGYLLVRFVNRQGWAGYAVDSEVNSEAWRRLWRYLDENAEAGTRLKKLMTRARDQQEFGQQVAHYALSFVRKAEEPLREQRRNRGIAIKRKLDLGVKGIEKAVEVYRFLADIYQKDEFLNRAARLEQEMNDLQEICAKRDKTFNVKSLGTAGSWSLLVMLQEYVLAETGQGISYIELADLIEAAGYALFDDDSEVVDAELIRKNLENFRKRKPRFVQLGKERAQQSAREKRKSSAN